MKKKSANKLKKTMKHKLKKKPIKKESEYKKTLESIKNTDSEFYDFLKKNDKDLLNFNLFDSENEDDNDAIDGNSKQTTISKDDSKEEENEDEEMYHKLPEQLEVPSDESDFEEDQITGNDFDEDNSADDDNIDCNKTEPSNKLKVQKITLTLLKDWQKQLQMTNVSIDIIRNVCQAFSSALASLLGDGESAIGTYKVLGSAVFNGTLQLCVLYLQPAIMRYLKAPKNKPLQKSKNWSKIRSALRCYLNDLIHLIEEVSSLNILSVLLKHLHQMSALVAPFSALGKSILKRLIELWSTAEETIRILAFLCILKITRNQQGTMLNPVLKSMYLSYVRNSKFVSPSTLPGINFMRRSLVEMFTLDLTTTYQHAFLYIRQLAIHLRNAVILKKKDSFQAVYNWQYINSLRLWSELLSLTASNDNLQPLVYPLVTITIGVIRLIPTAQYFPLRFHCIQLLISLVKGTNCFIPILPFIFDVLKSKTFNEKHTAVSMKPLQFTCILRLNKAQLSQNGFRDEVIEQIYALCLEYLSHESNSIAYCELVTSTISNIKAYLKTCRSANHSRKLKQLVEKIQDNYKFIEERRLKMTHELKEAQKIDGWEAQINAEGTPLQIYYQSWLKTHEMKKKRQAAQSDEINDNYGLPILKKVAKKEKSDAEMENMELFPTDDEDEADNGEMESMDSNKHLLDYSDEEPTICGVNKPIENLQEKYDELPVEELDEAHVDIVKDLDLDDW